MLLYVYFSIAVSCFAQNAQDLPVARFGHRADADDLARGGTEPRHDLAVKEKAK
jgi:hypothetical protein